MTDDTRDSTPPPGARARWHTPSMILGTLPLLVYPGIFMAGVMGLSAPRRGGSSSVGETVAAAFLWMSLAYPIAWGISGIVFLFVSRAAGSSMALGYLAVCTAFFVAWYSLTG